MLKYCYKGGGILDEKKRDDFSRFQALDDGLVKFFRFFANLSAIALCVIMFLAFVDVVGVRVTLVLRSSTFQPKMTSCVFSKVSVLHHS